MKQLTEYISEKLKLNKNIKVYKYYPETGAELKSIIK